MKTSQNGDMVVVHYVGTLDDGTMFDKTEEDNPVSFVVGADTILPDINKAFVGMKEGDEKKISIAPEHAFGPWDPNKTRKISLLVFGESDEPQIGQLVKLQLDGEEKEAYGKITKIDSHHVEVDTNHPLAGQTLHYTLNVVRIVKKEDAAKE